MSRPLRCPECGEGVARAGAGRPIACPACGAKCASDPAARSVRGAGGAGGPPARRPKGKRVKKQSAPAIPVLLWAIPAAALGLLAVTAVGAWLLWAALAKPRPGPVAGDGGEDVAGAGDAAEAPPAATFPPVAWAVPPGGAAAGPPVADVIDALDVSVNQPVFLFRGNRDRYLTPVLRPDPANPGGTYHLELGFGRLDPATGKTVGQPDLVLGPEYMAGNAPGMADVAPDGTLAAMRVNGKTAETAGAISVFAPGSKEPRKLPAATAYAKWFGWSAGGRLLVLKDGKLTAWEPAADKPAFEVGEKLAEPVALSPARNWLVAGVDGQYLEMHDTATGEVRGRLGGEGDWRFLDVSSDGKRLAGVRYKPLATGVPVNHPYDAELHAWDLATGERTARLRETKPGRVTWAGPNHLFHDGRVFDLDAGVAVTNLTPPATPEGIIPVPSPDGRLWWSARNGQAFTAAIPTTPANGRMAFTKGVPVRLEISCSDARREAPARAALTKQLAAVGHPVGEGPWLLKVKAEEYDVGRSLLVNGQTVPQPGVKGEMKLLAPDGTAVATAPVGGQFQERGSKYFVRERRDETQFGAFTLEYDFRGADPRQAMRDEVWGQFVRFPADVGRLPTVWEVGGKFQPLPLPVTLSLPAGLRPK